MIAFSIIGILSLVLIYFVLRSQNAQRELILARSSARTSTKRVNQAFKHIMVLANEQQKEMLIKLQAAHSKGLIKTGDFQRLEVLFAQFTTIVMLCSEKGASVEAALKATLKKEEINLQDVREVVKNMPTEVRMNWSKNTCEGFVNACAAMTRTFMGKTEKSDEQQD